MAPKSDLFIGYDKISDWAKADEPRTHYLVINDPKDFIASKSSVFEGLYHHQPSIYIDGAYIPLSKNHKVIFLNKNKNLQEIEFFQNHYIDASLPDLTFEYIYNKMLSPILGEYKDSQNIYDKLLKLYQFTQNLEIQHGIETSPKILGTIARMISHSKIQYDKKISPLDIADYYIYELFQTKIPAKYRKEFDKDFKPAASLNITKIADDKYSESENFIFTPSRAAIKDKVEEFLQLRRDRIETLDSNYSNEINIIVLEGPSGGGKSSLVNTILAKNHFQEISDSQELTDSMNGQVYYRMPASMDSDAALLLLVNAAKQGALVFTDEINSTQDFTSMMTKLWDTRSAAPGFMVIGTQNANKHDGRNPDIPESIKIHVDNYTQEEMHALLKELDYNMDPVLDFINFRDALHAAEEHHQKLLAGEVPDHGIGHS